MIQNIIISSVRQGFLATLALAAGFMLIEPAVSYGNQFTETLNITKEVAFVTPASNVVLAPALGGITGGTATGNTQFAIATNDVAGFSVTLQASSSVGMLANASTTASITAYKPAATAVPDYTYTVRNSSGTAFGYTVDSTSSADLAPAFLTNGSSACNTGSTDPALAHCWLNASTTATTVINRTQATYGGVPASSTIAFQVVVNTNPNPTLPNDTYTATTTLTATTN